MSLNWNLEKIENNKELCWTPQIPSPSDGVKPEDLDENGQIVMMNPVTNALIWATISVKLGKITEENAAEFYSRLTFTQRVNGGAFLYDYKDGERSEYWITPQDVRDHIGLTCNVSDETRAKFLGGFQMDLERLEWDYRKKTKEEETAAA
jgi:hypothetical protein